MDQTAKRDEGKLMLSLVPMEGLEAIAAIRHFGLQKYSDPDNWKRVEKGRYLDAAMRHLIAYIREPYGMDGESNLPHLWHCLCNLDFLCALDIQDGTTPKPQEAVKKMHHPEPVGAARSDSKHDDGYIYAYDLQTPGIGSQGDCG